MQGGGGPVDDTRPWRAICQIWAGYWTIHSVNQWNNSYLQRCRHVRRPRQQHCICRTWIAPCGDSPEAGTQHDLLLRLWRCGETRKPVHLLFSCASCLGRVSFCCPISACKAHLFNDLLHDLLGYAVTGSLMIDIHITEAACSANK